MNDSSKEAIGWAGALVIVALGVAVAVAVGIGGCGLYKNWQRGQARANARNRVAITKIEIQNQDQQAQVVAAQSGIVKQQAYQRWLQAVGIRKAQNEIDKTLSPLYVQWEAIQAQEAEARSGNNNTMIYIPVGPNGVPIVNALSPKAPGSVR